MVIVHSENEKQLYLEAIARELGEGMRAFWKDKIFYMDSTQAERDVKPDEETADVMDCACSEDLGETLL